MAGRLSTTIRRPPSESLIPLVRANFKNEACERGGCEGLALGSGNVGSKGSGRTEVGRDTTLRRAAKDCIDAGLYSLRSVVHPAQRLFVDLASPHPTSRPTNRNHDWPRTTNPATSTLTITASARSGTLTAASDSGRFSSRAYYAFLPLLGVVMIGVGTAGRASKGRHRHLWILASLFVALVILQTGCGSGSATQQPPPPPPQNYSVTVTGTSGSLTHTTQIAVTVQ